MAHTNGLRDGWRLFKLKGDAEIRRGVLLAAADRINDAMKLPPGPGRFTVAPCRRDMEPSQTFGQLARTLSTLPGLFEYRCAMRMVPHPDPYTSKAEQLRLLLGDTVYTIDDVRDFDPTGLQSLAAKVLEIVGHAIEPTQLLQIPVRMVGMGASSILLHHGTYVTVDLATVGHDLRVGVDRFSSVEDSALIEHLPKAVAEHVRLQTIASEAAAAGASGWIDGAAGRILSSSGLPLEALIGLLSKSSIVEMSAAIGGRPRRTVALRWRDGVITGLLRDPRDDFRYERGLLSLPLQNLPETLLTALPGRPLGSLIEHPLIPTAPVIIEIREQSGKMLVELDETVTPLPSVTSEA